MGDEAIVKRPSAGEPEPEESFEAFRQRTVRRVQGTLVRMGIFRDADLRDAIQEVYRIASTKRAMRNPAAPESAWLRIILRRVAFKHFHAIGREAPADTPDIEDELVSEALSPAEIVEKRLHYDAIVGVLRRERREVFDLHLDGFTGEEIAGQLGIPLGTVATRLRLALVDVGAARRRLSAREAHAEARPPQRRFVLLPFVAGMWEALRRLFGAEPGRRAADLPSRGPARGDEPLARGVSPASAAVSETLAGAGFGSGVVVGAATLAGVLALVHLFNGTPPTPIVRAPDVVATAAAARLPAPPSATPPRTAPFAAPVAPDAVSTASAAGATVPADHVDPEERRILRQARAAWVRGKLDELEAALDEHARRFPPGRARMARDAGALRANLDAARAGGGASITTGVVYPHGP